MTGDGRYGSINGAELLTCTEVFTGAMLSLIACSEGSADLTSTVSVAAVKP